jgi:hypothetical protein
VDDFSLQAQSMLLGVARSMMGRERRVRPELVLLTPLSFVAMIANASQASVVDLTV